MSGSVPSASQAQATFAATLFDELVHLGLRDVVLSPGSRSTPLALAASARPELTLHVRLDERSAGFFALFLGLALAHQNAFAAVALAPFALLSILYATSFLRGFSDQDV